MKVWHKLLAVLFLGSSIWGLFFYSPSKNYEEAYIRKSGGKYAVTMKGKRLLMAHDPVSAFLRETYEDSITFIIPRADGVIHGHELPTRKGYYRLTGTINIHSNSMIFDLYFDNTDDNIKNPLSWNGEYLLIRK